MLSFGPSPCDGALLPNGLVVRSRGFVQALGTSRLQARFLSRHGISDAAGSLISPRLQPARYVFAIGFPLPVTRIFVPPLETPAPCRVRLAATTLKPCENFAVYRIRLFLPYILRSTPLLGATGEKARRMPKRFYEKLPIPGRSHLRGLIDTTCSVLFARR